MPLNNNISISRLNLVKIFSGWVSVSIQALLKNYLSAMLLLGLGYLFYSRLPHFRDFFSATYSFPAFDISGSEILSGVLTLYAIFLIPFYMTFTEDDVPKSRLFWRAVFKFYRTGLSHREKTAVLAILVKFFFMPLMLVWLFGHLATMFYQWSLYMDIQTFFPNGYWLIFQSILLLDVLFFALGYMIEHPCLGNEIRSVEPTLLGWSVALVCYPPFNGMMNEVLGWHSADYPEFQSVMAQYIAGIAMLVFLAIYAWASLALNLKASNLTHRGIVNKGPYRWVRHPAYIAKNIAWWIGGIPIVMFAWQEGIGNTAYIIFGILGWTFIYYLRAITEERHLSRDGDYVRYCQSVRYRFIPGLI